MPLRFNEASDRAVDFVQIYPSIPPHLDGGKEGKKSMYVFPSCTKSKTHGKTLRVKYLRSVCGHGQDEKPHTSEHRKLSTNIHWTQMYWSPLAWSWPPESLPFPQSTLGSSSGATETM